MIVLCIPVLNRYDLIYNCLLSIEKNTVKPDLVYILDNGNQFKNYCIPLEFFSFPTEVYTFGENIGVTKSFNHFLEKFEECFIINDDIQLKTKTIEKFMECIQQNPNELVFVNSGHPWFMFSLFYIKRAVMTKVGKFDENFFSYWSDLDFKRRLKNNGFGTFIVPDTKMNHAIGGSKQNLDADGQKWWNNQYLLDELYFKTKWGPTANREEGGYQHPFNLNVEGLTIS